MYLFRGIIPILLYNINLNLILIIIGMSTVKRFKAQRRIYSHIFNE